MSDTEWDMEEERVVGRRPPTREERVDRRMREWRARRERANEFGETLNEDPSLLESLHGDIFRDANQSFRAPERRRARRSDWHAQQREQALAEQAGHDQEIGHTLQDASNSVARRILGSSTVAPRAEWHARQRRDVRYDQHPDRQREERGSTQTPGLYDPHPPTQTREDWHANQRGEESPTEALWRRIEERERDERRARWHDNQRGLVDALRREE